MTATINGERREVSDGTTVAALLRSLGLPGEGVAVAVNGEVVRRAAAERMALCDGDVVEIIKAVAGG